MRFLTKSLMILMKGLLPLMMISTVESIASQAAGSISAFEGDSFGNMIMVWEDDEDKTSLTMIKAAVKPNGSNWVLPPRIISKKELISVKPILAVSENGNAVALWMSNNPSTSYLALVGSMLPLGGEWTAPVEISDGIHEQVLNDSYGVSFNNNEIVAVWKGYVSHDGGPSHFVIRTATAPFGGSWSPPLTFEHNH